MNVSQGIFNMYWHILLKHLKNWSKIAWLSKDIRNWCHQACKLVLFCNQEFTRYLWQLFVTNNREDCELAMNTKPDVDVVAQIAVDFHAFLVNSHQQVLDDDES